MVLKARASETGCILYNTYTKELQGELEGIAVILVGFICRDRYPLDHNVSLKWEACLE